MEKPGYFIGITLGNVWIYQLSCRELAFTHIKFSHPKAYVFFNKILSFSSYGCHIFLVRFILCIFPVFLTYIGFFFLPLGDSQVGSC